MRRTYYDSMRDNTSLAVALDNAHRQIISQYEEMQKYQQMKKEIVEELKPFITQAIDIQVQNNATPALQELDKMLKNLGNL